MAERRLASAVLAVTGAVLLPVSLFLDWFRVNTGDTEFDITGWDSFEITDVALLACAAVALVSVVRPRRPAPGGRDQRLLLTGVIALAIVAVQLIDKPPFLGFGLHVSLRVGALLGLAGAALVLAAGALRALAGSGSREPGGL